MMAAIAHRGPDDEGLLLKPSAALGMRRLSIIDLAGGHQPIYNETGDVAVVFNGEIYNFHALAAELESRHSFRTRSDTEVIVHAYEEWGPSFLDHLRGMFALAVWDGRGAGHSPSGSRTSAGRILLARDRLGIKPLYYTKVDGTLLFASEVRALLASGIVSRRLSRESVEAYLLFGSVVEPETLLEGVFSLPPGYLLDIACAPHQEIKPRLYWHFADSEKAESREGKPQDLASAGRAVRPLLEEAVRSHLLADVPLGLFLSSGLDSTAIAALAARERSNLHTFTIVFPEQEFSEAPLARETASRLGCEHREFLVSSEQVQTQLADAVGALDQPSMDGINTYFVSWAARQVGLKVAISGLGGDEVFGGYPTFRSTPRIAAVAAIAAGIPFAFRRAVLAAVSGMTGGKSGTISDGARKVLAVWRDPGAVPHPYFFARLLFTPEQVKLLLLPRSPVERAGLGTSWRCWLDDAVRRAEAFRGDSRVSWLEMRAYMADTLLRDTDSMSMHHSLEVRVPLLDHVLVEFVASLPDSAKKKRGISKALLVEALGPLLPPTIVSQPKRTFTFPWQRWLRGPLGSHVAERLQNPTPSLCDVLDARTAFSIWNSFLAGRTGWARPWSLFTLDDWVRRHIDETESVFQGESPAASALAS
jgi:asparagine synthase (glutamine-hydrolysing)